MEKLNETKGFQLRSGNKPSPNKFLGGAFNAIKKAGRGLLDPAGIFGGGGGRAKNLLDPGGVVKKSKGLLSRFF